MSGTLYRWYSSTKCIKAGYYTLMPVLHFYVSFWLLTSVDDVRKHSLSEAERSVSKIKMTKMKLLWVY